MTDDNTGSPDYMHIKEAESDELEQSELRYLRKIPAHNQEPSSRGSSLGSLERQINQIVLPENLMNQKDIDVKTLRVGEEVNEENSEEN